MSVTQARSSLFQRFLNLIERIGNTDCICLVTDPDAHEQRQNRMYFGPMVGDLGVVWSRADGFEARINVVGLDI